MLGDFTPGKTIPGKFNTHKADGTPITLAGTPALSVYKDSTTESTAGVTLTVDYDARTGLHRYSIDTGADGTFYAAGNDFQIVITTGTVDSISVVGTVVGSFSLSNRSALRPTTADRTFDVSATGEGGLDFDNVKAATAPTTLTNITVPVTTSAGSVAGDVAGKVLGGGGGTITGTGARVVDDSGNAVAPASATTLILADTNALVLRLTAARAGYLDNLNVGGAVASQADINALNQSASRRVILTTVGQYERPESGSSTFQIEARTYDGDGAAVNADSTPTLTATGFPSGTNLSGNLSVATNPATGVYRWTYTVTSGATLEQVAFDIAATIGAAAFPMRVYSQVCDFTSANWTATDAANLTAIFNKLPTNNIADQTLLAAAIDGVPTNAEFASAVATLATPAQVLAQAAAALAAYDPPTNAEMELRTLLSAQYGLEATNLLVKAKTDLIPASPAAVGSAMTLEAGERAAIAAAWGARVLGNSRTADMFLQGLTNRIEFAADGLSFTVYATNDTDPLVAGVATRLAADVGGLRSINPA